MDLAIAPEDAAFRQQVRTFLADKLPERLRYKVENGVEQQYDDMLEWHHILARPGWVAPNWPAEYGGPGWSLTQKYIFDEEMGLAGAPRIVSFGINMCGPVLMAFGTPEQRQRHLPPMLLLAVFCLFSMKRCVLYCISKCLCTKQTDVVSFRIAAETWVAHAVG